MIVELIYLLIIITLTYIVSQKDKTKIKVVYNDFLKVTKKSISYVLFIIVIAACIQVFIPTDIIIKYLGNENRFLAPVLTALFASIIEGPTIIAFILGYSLLSSGASVSAVIAFISSFSMVGLIAVPLESKELGKQFSYLRLVYTLIISVILGIVSEVIINII